MSNRQITVLLGLVGIFGCGDSEAVGGRAPHGGHPATGGGGASGGASGGAQVTGGGGHGGAASGGAAGSSEGGQVPSPDVFEVDGWVVDQEGEPLEGAFVLQAGGAVQAETLADGAFQVTLTREIDGVPTVAAGKIGYRTAGLELPFLPNGPITLVAYEAELPDNATGYQYGQPGTGDHTQDISTDYCGHCHQQFAAEWNLSKHSVSAKNFRVQDLYAGVASIYESAGACEAVGGTLRLGAVPGAPAESDFRCYLGSGVLPALNACDEGALACDDPQNPDPPEAFGGCADCHAPGMDGPVGGKSLLEAEGLGYQAGVHCDFCHKIRDVDLEAPPGVGGRLILQRPSENLGKGIGSPTRPLMFGPLRDVPLTFMGGSYQPKFKEAEFCAGCHEQNQEALIPGETLDPRFPEGLPIHSTFTEWSEGPFNDPDTPCQRCHMPETGDLFNPVDVSSPSNAGITFGFGRTSEDIRAHTFRGPTLAIPSVPRLIDGAAQLSLEASQSSENLTVEVGTRNVACGHALPTGEPLRALILVVSVRGCNATFAANGGHTVNDVGGFTVKGVFGEDLTSDGAQVVWPEGAPSLPIGSLLRVVRPTGAYWDYDGIGLFAGATLSPEGKGMPMFEPRARAIVIGRSGDRLTLFPPPDLSPGDVLYAGTTEPSEYSDAMEPLPLAGASGATFAKVLVSSGGERQVPHFRAVSIASDNRIAPQTTSTTTHRFAIPAGCNEGVVRATLLYRPLPLALERERGWNSKDEVVAEASLSVALQ